MAEKKLTKGIKLNEIREVCNYNIDLFDSMYEYLNKTGTSRYSAYLYVRNLSLVAKNENDLFVMLFESIQSTSDIFVSNELTELFTDIFGAMKRQDAEAKVKKLKEVV